MKSGYAVALFVVFRISHLIMVIAAQVTCNHAVSSTDFSMQFVRFRARSGLHQALAPSLFGR